MAEFGKAGLFGPPWKQLDGEAKGLRKKKEEKFSSFDMPALGESDQRDLQEQQHQYARVARAGNHPVSRKFAGNEPFFVDATEYLANQHFQFLQFYHVPTGRSVAFKAFIQTFEDSYDSDWNEELVYGRMDPIATFKRTSRRINATFTIPAVSIQESVVNLQRMAALIQFLYPKYSGNTIRGAPFMKVQFMNWIQKTSDGPGMDPKESGLLGYLNGVSFTPNMDAGVFQTGLEIFPKEMTVSFQLNVVHEENPAENPEHPYGLGFNDKEIAFTSETMTDEQKDLHEELTRANVSQMLGD